MTARKRRVPLRRKRKGRKKKKMPAPFCFMPPIGRKRGPKPRGELSPRQLRIVLAVLRGRSYSSTGRRYGCSRQYVGKCIQTAKRLRERHQLLCEDQ